MICISINQESRRFALADMVNAKLFGDVLELRLDRFGKSPDIGEMIAARPKPMIMVCKRPEDGGSFDGTEQERLAILRQCIISKADYVEIELDVADDIRPFPPSKRVISYTNLSETPIDILNIYEEMKEKRADVIKLMTLARTPEEAWPLVQILAKAVVPTVIVGLGRPGIMLSLLSKKLGAPWIYAALERGLEAYPGQTTVEDLDTIYRFKDIQKGTRLIGVTGLGEREQIAAAALNAAFAHHEMAFRCLPMPVGNIKVFRKIMEAVKLAGAVIDPEHQAEIMEISPEVHGLAKETQAADVLIHKSDGWHAMHMSGHAWVNALKNALKKRFPNDPFKDRFVLCAGLSGAAKVIAREVQRQGGNAIIASSDKKRGQAFAQEAGCRYIALEALYVTLHDVLVYCADETDEKLGKVGTIHAGYLKPGMIVADLTAGARSTQLLRDASSRGCDTVVPLDLTLDLLELQAKTLTGKPTPRDVLLNAIPPRFLEQAE
ncbi:MAG: type I 3-dehydroquinate dehydratase [Planctomycetes bacterium]|nr:type I 3-dehydroquinate dehydratase [Planctomycetota bacterium]